MGDTPGRTNYFYRECRERLAKTSSKSEFSADDLIDEALLRLFLGNLLDDMKFPTNQPDLIDAVERLGKLHLENANRKHRRHGPRPVSLDENLPADLIAQVSSKQFTSLQSMQLDILRRLEDQLLKRIAQIEFSKKPSNTDSDLTIESEINRLG